MLLKQLLEFRTADAFGQAGRDDDRAALLDDRQCAGHPFHRLIKRRISGYPAAEVTTTSTGSETRSVTTLADKLYALLEGLHHVASHELQRPTLGIDDHVDNEIAACMPSDPGVFLVNRVAFKDAAIGVGMLEKRGAVPGFDRFQGRDARADQLAAARKSRPSSAARSVR